MACRQDLHRSVGRGRCGPDLLRSAPRHSRGSVPRGGAGKRVADSRRDRAVGRLDADRALRRGDPGQPCGPVSVMGVHPTRSHVEGAQLGMAHCERPRRPLRGRRRVRISHAAPWARVPPADLPGCGNQPPARRLLLVHASLPARFRARLSLPGLPFRSSGRRDHQFQTAREGATMGDPDHRHRSGAHNAQWSTRSVSWSCRFPST